MFQFGNQRDKLDAMQELRNITMTSQPKTAKVNEDDEEDGIDDDADDDSREEGDDNNY